MSPESTYVDGGPAVESSALWAMETTGIGWCCAPDCSEPLTDRAVSCASGLYHPECAPEQPAPSWTESIAYTPTVNPRLPWRFACPRCEGSDGFARVESLADALDLARRHRCSGSGSAA